MAGKQTDFYANIAFMSVLESAANTLTWKRLQLASSLMSEKAALIIHRADIQLTQHFTVLNANTAIISCCCSVSDRITDIRDLSQAEILFQTESQRVEASAVGTHIVPQPQTLDFSTLPGAGIIVPADNLYVGIKGTTCGAAGLASIRIYYTVKALKTEEYWDLIEARRVMTT
jgi:hypothetical protein